jgi:hypothetical protein
MNPLTLPNHPRIVHPRTGMPVQAIAQHPRTGRLVWPIMGGDGSEADANEWSKVFGEKTPEQVKTEYDAAVAKAAAPPAQGENPWSKLFPGETPEQVQEKLANSRKWEERAKDNKPKADVAKALLEVLGMQGETPAPDAAAQQLSATQAEAKATKIENAVLRRTMVKDGETVVNVDTAGLSDSRTFMDKVAKLDPAAEDFTTQLDTTIAAFVKDNPRYLATTVPGSTRPAPVKQQGQQSAGKTGGVAAGHDLFQASRTDKPKATAAG